MINYKILPSWRKNKKFAVLFLDKKNKLKPIKTIHFGDKRYKDFTQHRNLQRRAAYLKRAAGIRDKKGNLTINNPYSPNYWATRKLWAYKQKL